MLCGVISEKSDVKRLHIFNNYTFEKRYYYINESEKMIYCYYIPEEYHPRPDQRSWDKLNPDYPNGFTKEAYHRIKSKSVEFTMIPDDDYKNRITLTFISEFRKFIGELCHFILKE